LDEEAFLQKIPYPVTPTNLKGVYAGVAPPDDFDPNTASQSDLLKNGTLWRRPTAADPPSLRAVWQKVFSRKWLAQDRVMPVMEPQVGRVHILKRAPRKVGDMNYLGGAWAGAATFSGGSNQRRSRKRYGNHRFHWMVQAGQGFRGSAAVCRQKTDTLEKMDSG
jgi:hypothetical protein